MRDWVEETTGSFTYEQPRECGADHVGHLERIFGAKTEGIRRMAGRTGEVRPIVGEPRRASLSSPPKIFTGQPDVLGISSAKGLNCSGSARGGYGDSVTRGGYLWLAH